MSTLDFDMCISNVIFGLLRTTQQSISTTCELRLVDLFLLCLGLQRSPHNHYAKCSLGKRAHFLNGVLAPVVAFAPHPAECLDYLQIMCVHRQVSRLSIEGVSGRGGFQVRGDAQLVCQGSAPCQQGPSSPESLAFWGGAEDFEDYISHWLGI